MVLRRRPSGGRTRRPWRSWSRSLSHVGYRNTARAEGAAVRLDRRWRLSHPSGTQVPGDSFVARRADPFLPCGGWPRSRPRRSPSLGGPKPGAHPVAGWPRVPRARGGSPARRRPPPPRAARPRAGPCERRAPPRRTRGRPRWRSARAGPRQRPAPPRSRRRRRPSWTPVPPGGTGRGGGHTVGSEHGDQRLARPDGLQQLGHVVVVGARERRGGPRHGLLVLRRVGAQACWTRLPSCPRTSSGRSVGDWVTRNPDALRADHPHRGLDGLTQRLGRALEQQVGLVQEEDQLRALGVAELGRGLVQLREQPHHEGGEDPRLRLHVGQVHDRDHAPTVALAEQVDHVEGGLAEELLGALLVELHRLAQQTLRLEVAIPP